MASNSLNQETPLYFLNALRKKDYKNEEVCIIDAFHLTAARVCQSRLGGC